MRLEIRSEQGREFWEGGNQEKAEIQKCKRPDAALGIITREEMRLFETSTI